MQSHGNHHTLLGLLFFSTLRSGGLWFQRFHTHALLVPTFPYFFLLTGDVCPPPPADGGLFWLMHFTRAQNLSCSLSMQDQPGRQDSDQLTNVLRFALAFGVQVCVCVTKGTHLVGREPQWNGGDMHSLHRYATLRMVVFSTRRSEVAYGLQKQGGSGLDSFGGRNSDSERLSSPVCAYVR